MRLSALLFRLARWNAKRKSARPTQHVAELLATKRAFIYRDHRRRLFKPWDWEARRYGYHLNNGHTWTGSGALRAAVKELNTP